VKFGYFCLFVLLALTFQGRPSEAFFFRQLRKLYDNMKKRGEAKLAKALSDDLSELFKHEHSETLKQAKRQTEELITEKAEDVMEKKAEDVMEKKAEGILQEKAADVVNEEAEKAVKKFVNDKAVKKVVNEKAEKAVKEQMKKIGDESVQKVAAKAKAAVTEEVAKVEDVVAEKVHEAAKKPLETIKENLDNTEKKLKNAAATMKDLQVLEDNLQEQIKHNTKRSVANQDRLKRASLLSKKIIHTLSEIDNEKAKILRREHRRNELYAHSEEIILRRTNPPSTDDKIDDNCEHEKEKGVVVFPAAKVEEGETCEHLNERLFIHAFCGPKRKFFQNLRDKLLKKEHAEWKKLRKKHFKGICCPQDKKCKNKLDIKKIVTKNGKLHKGLVNAFKNDKESIDHYFHDNTVCHLFQFDSLKHSSQKMCSLFHPYKALMNMFRTGQKAPSLLEVGSFKTTKVSTGDQCYVSSDLNFENMKSAFCPNLRLETIMKRKYFALIDPDQFRFPETKHRLIYDVRSECGQDPSFSGNDIAMQEIFIDGDNSQGKKTAFVMDFDNLLKKTAEECSNSHSIRKTELSIYFHEDSENCCKAESDYGSCVGCKLRPVVDDTTKMPFSYVLGASGIVFQGHKDLYPILRLKGSKYVVDNTLCASDNDCPLRPNFLVIGKDVNNGDPRNAMNYGTSEASYLETNAVTGKKSNNRWIGIKGSCGVINGVTMNSLTVFTNMTRYSVEDLLSGAEVKFDCKKNKYLCSCITFLQSRNSEKTEVVFSDNTTREMLTLTPSRRGFASYVYSVDTGDKRRRRLLGHGRRRLLQKTTGSKGGSS
jgi:hypothetical protein